MQIDIDLLESPLAKLSGGQKSKIAFAQVLYSKSEILLLDEPTNHLDASTKDFVTTYLKNYKGMVMIISHDIAFLNQIINKTLFINKVTHKISVYDGNYYTYKKKYAEEQRLCERLIVQQEKEIKELADFVQRAKQATQTNHAIKRMGQERALRLEKKRSKLQSRDRVVDTEGYTKWRLRSVLSNFLFYEEDVNKKVGILSPGEKARIALCKVLLQKANLLILDEPTNHLDPETQAIIGGNFNLFEGTIIVVSHNPSFVEQIGINRMLILPSGRIEYYSHELLEYYYELNTIDDEFTP